MGFALQSEGGLVNPSDSSDSEDTSGTSGGGMSEVIVRLSGVDSGTSPKPRARRGCKCFPPELIAAFLECKSGEGPSEEPGMYVRPGQPRAGRAQMLGRTTIGDLSYVEGEWAEKVRVRVGEGGKWTVLRHC
ncbi:hypothetical protein BJV77DRAFT_991276 [Russula vinacea]|nr:hypothetical protein BJV77DRAFT_991276 [Russula vinacea]